MSKIVHHTIMFICVCRLYKISRTAGKIVEISKLILASSGMQGFRNRIILRGLYLDM